ncbi:hypothetical protein RRG08_059946 [Elysia crispata]|uniref:Uncharacterized protein n=1 Tax=Elysia crispata TaxID=231223 RepID=A0AAE1CU33_9GAST|nr:hypothetical protein RRG08_059946 [Elysia crispata]
MLSAQLNDIIAHLMNHGTAEQTAHNDIRFDILAFIARAKLLARNGANPFTHCGFRPNGVCAVGQSSLLVNHMNRSFPLVNTSPVSELEDSPTIYGGLQL